MSLYKPRTAAIYFLYFCSGGIALIYEVLWMRQLGLIFGNTAYATAATLTAFFIGLALGGQVWGKRAKYFINPLRVYGYLELGVSVTALGYLALIPLYRSLYPWLFSEFADYPGIFLSIKLILAMMVLCPPAFLIGGTLPVMSQHIAKNIAVMGRKVSSLYAINTLGAALGAFAAGFYLPTWLGLQAAYLLAVTTTALIGIGACLLSRSNQNLETSIHQRKVENTIAAGNVSTIKLSQLRGLSMLSGFTTLALQVLWTRMFAQVLQNSAYTFSIIVVVFLIILAVAAGLANIIIRSRISPKICLVSVILMGVIFTSTSPWLFNLATEGLQYYKNNVAWELYLLQVFSLAFLVMGAPLFCLGMVFPILLRLAQTSGLSTGKTVGQLAAVNTWGSAAGALLAGFIMLDQFGLWNSIGLVALINAGVSLILLKRTDQFTALERATWGSIAICSIISMGVLATNYRTLPSVRLKTSEGPETVLDVAEGSAATVAVIERGGQFPERFVVLNNTYTLGGSGSQLYEKLQGSIALSLHPNPQDVYFLGMGTGISCGAALDFPVKTVTVTELVPEVIRASKNYFEAYLNGLFSDPRVQIIADDGRNFLHGNQQRYDVIIADLFLPWKAGTGNLYSLEHFQTIRERLRDDGLFMQWVPSYQVTYDELAIISRTMLKVFPRVTLWRGDFVPDKSIVGLMGHNNVEPVSPEIALNPIRRPEYQSAEMPILTHYIGNLTTAQSIFANVQINRDDKPIIEYQAPVVNQNAQARLTTYLSGASLIRFSVNLQQSSPLVDDPYIAQIPANQRSFATAGLHLHRKEVLESRGQQAAAELDYQQFERLYHKLAQPNTTNDDPGTYSRTNNNHLSDNPGET